MAGCPAATCWILFILGDIVPWFMDQRICEHVDEKGEISAVVEEANGKVIFFGNLEHGIQALQESSYDPVRTAEAISSIRSMVLNSRNRPPSETQI